MRKSSNFLILGTLGVKEYGILILIADPLERRINNENSTIQQKECATPRIGEPTRRLSYKVLSKNVRKTSLERALSLYIDLGSIDCTTPYNPKEVLSDRFYILLHHRGPH